LVTGTIELHDTNGNVIRIRGKTPDRLDEGAKGVGRG
jgi:hypothetical protein